MKTFNFALMSGNTVLSIQSISSFTEELALNELRNLMRQAGVRGVQIFLITRKA